MENFDFGQIIGEGGFATVHKAVDRRNNHEVAIKCINKAKLVESSLYHRASNEIRIHEQLKESHIIEALGSFEDVNYIYIIMEYCNGGNLFRYLRKESRLKEAEAVFVIMQIIQAVGYLHSKGLIHRDLKLSNILISHVYPPAIIEQALANGSRLENSMHDNSQVAEEEFSIGKGNDLFGETISNQPESNNGSVRSIAASNRFLKIKLCDFGLTIQMQHPDEEHYTLCGTPNYIAPEIVSNEAHGYPADIWSIGALYYSLVMGQPLFEQEEARQWLSGAVKSRNVARKAVEAAPESVLSIEAKNFLRLIFQTDPKLRPTVPELLKHALLQKYQSLFKKIQSVSGDKYSLQQVLPSFSVHSSIREVASMKTVESPFHAVSSGLLCDGSTEDLPLLQQYRPEPSNGIYEQEHHSQRTANVAKLSGAPPVLRQDMTFDEENFAPSLVTPYRRFPVNNRYSLQSMSARQSISLEKLKTNASLMMRSSGSILPVLPSNSVLQSSLQHAHSVSFSGSVDSQFSISQSVPDGLSHWAQTIQDISLSSSVSQHSDQMKGSTFAQGSNLSVGAAFARIAEQLPYLAPFLLLTRHNDLLLFTTEGHLVFTSLYNEFNVASSPKKSSLCNVRLVMSAQQKDRLWLGSVSNSMNTFIAETIEKYRNSSSAKKLSEASESRRGDVNSKKKLISSQDIMDPHLRMKAIMNGERQTLLVDDRTFLISIESCGIGDVQSYRKEILCRQLASGNLSSAVGTLLHRMMQLLKGVQSQLPKVILYCSSLNIRNNSKKSREARMKSRFGQAFGDQIVFNGSKTFCTNEDSLASIPPPPPPLSTEDESQSQEKGQRILDMKCMLMSNTPLPDFHAQWVDGTRLIYRLDRGHIVIDKPAHCSAESRSHALRWDGHIPLAPSHEHPSSITSGNLLLTVPEQLQQYLLTAQLAVTRCLREASGIDRNSTKSLGSMMSSNTSNLTSKTLRSAKSLQVFPIVIVDKD